MKTNLRSLIKIEKSFFHIKIITHIELKYQYLIDMKFIARFAGKDIIDVFIHYIICLLKNSLK